MTACFSIAGYLKTQFLRVHGEQKDSQLLAAERWMKEEWPKCMFSYLVENIYNGNETGLYFRALPEHT